jgi:hypothetical protein
MGWAQLFHNLVFGSNDNETGKPQPRVYELSVPDSVGYTVGEYSHKTLHIIETGAQTGLFESHVVAFPYAERDPKRRPLVDGFLIYGAVPMAAIIRELDKVEGDMQGLQRQDYRNFKAGMNRAGTAPGMAVA